MKEQITLCHRCKGDYIYAGYDLQRDYTVMIKEPCEICGKMGWTYLVERYEMRKDGRASGTAEIRKSRRGGKSESQ